MQRYRRLAAQPNDRSLPTLPTDSAVRLARLEKNFARLVSNCEAKLHAIGVNTSRLAPMQIVAMVRDEKQKERYRRKVLKKATSNDVVAGAIQK